MRVNKSIGLAMKGHKRWSSYENSEHGTIAFPFFFPAFFVPQTFFLLKLERLLTG